MKDEKGIKGEEEKGEKRKEQKGRDERLTRKHYD